MSLSVSLKRRHREAAAAGQGEKPEVMSASKKKRMGSQRRSLNQNLQDSPETSDTAKSPPVPQSRQRADARADLTPNSAQSEMPARKKLGSKRGNKEKTHFKDETLESSHKPLEEVEDTTSYFQYPDTLVSKNDSIEETLESSGSGLADFDLLLNESSNASSAKITEAILSMPQTSDLLEYTNSETGSDLLLSDGQNKKHPTKIASIQEGVLTEKDLAQQMPDILEATLPAGVTGESTCTVRLIEKEGINITGSHAGDEAGHLEKPVSQQSDESSLPTAKIRKLGSSRRRKDTNITGLQDQRHEMAGESDITANVLDTTDFTIAQNTVVTVESPPDNIVSGGQLEINQTDTDYLSGVSLNLLKVKEEPQVAELLAEFKDREVEETKPEDYEKVVGPQNLSELSSIEIPPTDDTIAPQTSPHPHSTVSVEEEEKILEIGDSTIREVLNETNELSENITVEDYLTTSGITATSNVNTLDKDFFATKEKEIADKEFKEEILVGSYVSSEIPSELERETSSIKDVVGAQIGMQSSTEELLHLDQNDSSDLFNVSAAKSEDKYEMYAAQTEDVHPVTSSVSVTDEDKASNSYGNPKDNISDDKKMYLIEQQLKTLPGQIYKGENLEEDVKLGDESQILNTEDILLPPHSSLDDVCDETENSITAEGFLKTETIVALVQDSTLKSDSYSKENVNIDLFDIEEGNKEIDEKSFKEETNKSSVSEELDMLLQPKDEALIEPIENKEYNIINVTTHPKLDVSQNDDVYQLVSSSVNVTDDGVNDSSAGFTVLRESTDQLLFSATNSEENERDESGRANNVVLLEQQPESLALSTGFGPEDQKEIIKLADETQEPQIQQRDDTDDSLTSPHPDVIADVQDVAHASENLPQVITKEEIPQQEPPSTDLSKDGQNVEEEQEIQEVGLEKEEISDQYSDFVVHADNITAPQASPHPDFSFDVEKSEEIIKPIIVTEETGHAQDHISDNQEHEVDKSLSQLVYDESRETGTQSKETDNEAILSSENLPKKEIPQQEPPSTDVSKDGQSVEEEQKIQEKNSDQYSDFTVHADNINAPQASPHPDVSVDEENLTAVGSQLIGKRKKLGSSRRTKARKPDHIESKQEEIDIRPNESAEITQDESVIEKQSQEMTIDNDVVVEQASVKELDKSFIQVHDEASETVVTTNKYLKPAEVTALFEEDQTVKENTSKNLLDIPDAVKNVISQQPNVDSLLRQESPTKLQNTEQGEVKAEIYALKEPINVHQLTYLSDSETHDEMDSFLLQQSKPSEAVPLDDVTEVQENLTAVEGDSLTVKDLKDKAEATRDADILEDITRGGSEKIIKANIEDTIQSVVMSAEDVPKDQQEVQDRVGTTAEPQITVTKRKMGSTRRSQLNRKQLDESRLTEDDAGISDNTTAIITAVNEDAESLSADIFVKQEETAAVRPVKQSNEDGADRKTVAQEEKKEEGLQTVEVALIKDINTGATMQNLQPIISEVIQPSSLGKRRKMGSTRKNLTPKKESPPEEMITPVNVGKEVGVSISNENNENKEHSGLLLPAASVQQQPPPDEETPLSQQDNKEKLSSESELDMSSHPDLMKEDEAVARRRKMGSHRKPHTDQSIRQGKDNEEILPHPMEERRAESPKLGTKVNERDNKASLTSAFNIKGNSRPVGQKIPQQLSQPSINVHRAQQSNIRIAAGNDPSVRKYEVVMIGDSSVGKTSFMQRAQSGKFSPDIPASIGMDSYKWTVVVEGRTVVLHLWDTAGQERFHSMTKQIFHRAQAFLLMYDVTCTQTYAAVTYWANCIKEGAGENVVILLLGNKSDSKERKVRREEGDILAQDNGFTFIECSAATGENVIEALETVARLLSQRTARREEPLELRKPEPRNKGCC